MLYKLNINYFKRRKILWENSKTRKVTILMKFG